MSTGWYIVSIKDARRICTLFIYVISPPLLSPREHLSYYWQCINDKDIGPFKSAVHNIFEINIRFHSKSSISILVPTSTFVPSNSVSEISDSPSNSPSGIILQLFMPRHLNNSTIKDLPLLKLAENKTWYRLLCKTVSEIVGQTEIRCDYSRWPCNWRWWGGQRSRLGGWVCSFGMVLIVAGWRFV
jgi:hypothetical protein